MNNKTATNETQTRRRHPQPWYYLPTAERETQSRHRSEQLAGALFPVDGLEQVHPDEPRGWALTHCVICGRLVASVILDSGVEHYADLALNEDGKLCAIVDLPHPCNQKFAAYAAAEADRGEAE